MTTPDPTSTMSTEPISDLAAAPEATRAVEPEAGPAATEAPAPATWTASDWLGKVVVDRDGHKIGKLRAVYVDVETDVPQFGTVKEGFLERHLTFVPLAGVTVGPDELRVTVLKEQVKSAPDLDLHGQEMSQADESALYHHFEMNYTAIASDSGRRLARR